MIFKMLHGSLVNSMLPQLDAWGETSRQVIKSKMEIQEGLFSSKNQFNCCYLQRGKKITRCHQVLLTSHFHPKFCNSQCCSQSSRVLRPCHQSSHFSENCSSMKSCSKAFCFSHTQAIAMNVMQTVRNSHFRQSRLGVGEREKEEPCKEI